MTMSQHQTISAAPPIYVAGDPVPECNCPTPEPCPPQVPCPVPEPCPPQVPCPVPEPCPVCPPQIPCECPEPKSGFPWWAVGLAAGAFFLLRE